MMPSTSTSFSSAPSRTTSFLLAAATAACCASSSLAYTMMSTATYSRTRPSINPYSAGGSSVDNGRRPGGVEYNPFRPQPQGGFGGSLPPLQQELPELTPLPKLACSMDKIDEYRGEVEKVQGSIQEALRGGDMPKARALYYGPLQDALKMDPLYSLQTKLGKAKGGREKAFFKVLRDLMQRGNTRFLMDTNQIAVLHKGGNGLDLVEGQLKYLGPAKKTVETKWKPESLASMLEEVAEEIATRPPPVASTSTGFGGRQRKNVPGGNAAAAAAAAANQGAVAASGGPGEMPYAAQGDNGSAGGAAEDQTQKQFQMPTWSPDGRYLAFTELYLNANGVDTCCLVVYDVRVGKEVARKTLPNAPHMIQFMPDSDSIIYLQNQHDNISLCSMVSVRELMSGQEQERVIDEGMPLFFATSKYNSARYSLVMNNGKRNGLYRYLGDMTLPRKAWKQLATHERKFRSPEVASTGLQDSVIFVMDNHLVAASVDGRYRKNICRVQGFCTLAVSPNGKHIALMEEDGATGFYQMSIISGRDATNPYGGTEYVQKTLPIKNVVASFYFSPDSQKLLLMVTTSPSHEFSVTRNTMNLGVSLTCKWDVYMLESGKVRSYGIFNPRPYQLKAFIPFFDQYRNSLSPWSPDSQAFCYCQREGAFIQRLQKTAVPEGLKKEMDRIRRGKPGLIFLPDIDDESSAYALGADLEVLTWSWC